MKTQSETHPIWDTFCAASIVGIWPRYIEPTLVTTSFLTLKVKDLPPELNHLRILQFSDLHFNEHITKKFIERIYKKAAAFSPDLIVFTGDFICKSKLSDELKPKLVKFLNDFPKAKYGSYAVLGNHDYAEYVSMNDQGEYAITPDSSAVKRGLGRLFKRIKLPTAMRQEVHAVAFNDDLMKLIAQTPFKLLHNVSSTVPINGSALNVAGLGEYTLGRADPEAAFRLWDHRFPGIILAHNPDCAPMLTEFPGSVILSGHTHGGQINLPLIWKRFLVLENMRYKKGIHYIHNKWLYVNRGLGAVLPFRWFAPPELLCLTLTSA